MPPVQAGAPTPFENAIPWLFVQGNETTQTFSALFQNGNFNWIYVLTGLDVTATQAQPVQCFFSASFAQAPNSGAPFYYDSQSTGEGLGVWFSWRGALPLRSGGVISLLGNSSANILWSWVAWGLRLPSVS